MPKLRPSRKIPPGKYTVAEYAKQTKQARSTVYYLIENGKLDTVIEPAVIIQPAKDTTFVIVK